MKCGALSGRWGRRRGLGEEIGGDLQAVGLELLRGSAGRADRELGRLCSGAAAAGVPAGIAPAAVRSHLLGWPGGVERYASLGDMLPGLTLNDAADCR